MQRGAQSTEQNPVKYWSFMGGLFAQRVPEGTKGATSRELTKGPNEGKIVHEIHMDTIVGALVDIKIKESQYGKGFQMIIDVTEPGEPLQYFAIDFKFDGAGKNLLYSLPNIDLSKDLGLKTYAIEDKEKGRVNYYCVAYQGSLDKAGKIEKAFTRENPNGLPEMVKIKVKGVEQWDDTAQIEFLENIILSIPYPGMDGEREEAPRATAPKVEEDPLFESPEADEIGF